MTNELLKYMKMYQWDAIQKEIHENELLKTIKSELAEQTGKKYIGIGMSVGRNL